MSLYDLLNEQLYPRKKSDIRVLATSIHHLEGDFCQVSQLVIRAGRRYLRIYRLEDSAFVEGSETYQVVSPNFRLADPDSEEDDMESTSFPLPTAGFASHVHSMGSGRSRSSL